MKTYIIAVDNGFYFFGTEVQSPADGYLAFENAAMFGGFSGGFGVAGVAKGKPGAEVVLDRIDGPLTIPTTRVVFILESVDLYKFKGTKIRG